MAGRPPLPTHLKVLRGTLRTSRENPAEPQLEPRFPDPPAYLSAEEHAAWATFAQVLTPMQVVAAEDAAVVEMLVTTSALRQRLAAILRREGPTYATEAKDGKVMLRAHPAMAQIADVDRRLLALLGRFGLTPSDRARVMKMSGGVGAGPEDEFSTG